MKGFFYVLLFLMVFACSSWAYEENFDSGEAVGWVANTGNWYVDDDVYVCGMGGHYSPMKNSGL